MLDADSLVPERPHLNGDRVVEPLGVPDIDAFHLVHVARLPRFDVQDHARSTCSHMYMRRIVIIEVDRERKPANAQHHRHGSMYPNGWVGQPGRGAISGLRDPQ